MIPNYPPEPKQIGCLWLIALAVVVIIIIAVAWYSDECIMGDACFGWRMP